MTLWNRVTTTCLECAKLRRENERLQQEVVRIKKLNDRMEEEIELIYGNSEGKNDTPPKADC
jgi:hypothetical protein